MRHLRDTLFDSMLKLDCAQLLLPFFFNRKFIAKRASPPWNSTPARVKWSWMNQFISYPFLISRTSRAHSPQTFSHRLFLRSAGRSADEESWAWLLCMSVRSPPFHQEFKTKRQTSLFSLEKHYQQPWMLRFHITRTHMKFLYVNCLSWIPTRSPTLICLSHDQGVVFFLIIYARA